MPRMLIRHNFYDTPVIVETQVDGTLVQCWALELLLHHGGINQFVGRMGYDDEDFTEFLALPPLDDADGKDMERAARRAIKEQYAKRKGSCPSRGGVPAELQANTARPGKIRPNSTGRSAWSTRCSPRWSASRACSSPPPT